MEVEKFCIFALYSLLTIVSQNASIWFFLFLALKVHLLLYIFL